ncbi:hypothetical protein [Nocardioides daejeonensis]|uniref:hypothetical protein n=1 Tax=Nocardioides daejeonensis TaxID=1046556 RepID=UPI001EF62C5D|nr:hypothetical protein [Nocardioides daejeonensis]
MPIQIATSARPMPRKSRATGPGPLRTARGAGRGLDVDRAAAFLGAALDAVFLEVLRDRVLEPDPLPRDVLELRDPGGEDVRVAMVRP